VSELFVKTGEVLGAVGDLRRCEFTSAEGLQGVALSHAGGTAALETIAAQASALAESFAAQVELLACTVSLGALDVLAADYTPFAGEGVLAGDG
jgi:hypothetical protein